MKYSLFKSFFPFTPEPHPGRPGRELLLAREGRGPAAARGLAPGRRARGRARQGRQALRHFTFASGAKVRQSKVKLVLVITRRIRLLYSRERDLENDI